MAAIGSRLVLLLPTSRESESRNSQSLEFKLVNIFIDYI